MALLGVYKKQGKERKSPPKERDKGKSDRYELTDDEDDKRSSKKLTLNINCIYGRQKLQ
ncbi:hypothetical protein C1H46_042829 [Malus baccata]|uniref:Uncharacterized protein n=1 Tax=Malus baccata TaxID=106549 RepID=A0A540KBN3_MALBA|nr:hypothetical protein C1H46_042829 [Malus baccata]